MLYILITTFKGATNNLYYNFVVYVLVKLSDTVLSLLLEVSLQLDELHE